MYEKTKKVIKKIKIYEKLVYEFLEYNEINEIKIKKLVRFFKIDYYSVFIILKDLKKDYDFYKLSDISLKNKKETLFLNSFKSIMYYRLSHLIYTYQYFITSRIISEYSHSLTQIDIHPGSIIGSPFFIDHGTGVVIGETTIIGRFVKIYHGVTLGAKLNPNENKIKRHPTIEDNVTIYCNTSIFGDIKIFKNTIIKAHSIIK